MLSNNNTKTALKYTIATIFCALFGAVYEIFSHGVYSYYMIYAFAFPLILGVLPNIILALSKKQILHGVHETVYNFAVAIFTVGSLACGVLEIYGTYNSLTLIYWIAGIICICLSIIIYLIKKLRGAGKVRQVN